MQFQSFPKVGLTVSGVGVSILLILQLLGVQDILERVCYSCPDLYIHIICSCKLLFKP